MWIYVVLETWSVFGVEILSGSFCDLSPWTWTFLGVFFLDPEMWTGTAYVLRWLRGLDRERQADL